MNHPATEKKANKFKQNRRRFLSDTARIVCGVGLLGTGLVLYTRNAQSISPAFIRPPGALKEKDFLAACIRCGMCVRDCPYGTLKLSKLGQEITVGTPYFEARKVPCEMCEDIPCVNACPTGALDKSLKNIDHARMGLAVLIDHETCLNYKGLRCDVCYRVCPLIDKAIKLQAQHNQRTGMHAMFIPVVQSNACTGCGKCEQACVLDKAAIKVLPIPLAKGSSGAHYKMGWQEKQKAGKSLVPPDKPHQFNLPEGFKYDYKGKGLEKKK